MSRPTPSVPSPFPFEAFARERGREREAEKRGLWKAILALMKSCDVIEKADFCPITLAGTVLLLARELDDAAYLARAYEVGLAAAKGFEVPEPQPKIEPLQVVAGTKPEPVLLARLAAEGFRRMSGEGVEPAIYMGHGQLAAWKAMQNNTVRITKVDLPGGAILGMEVVGADEGEGDIEGKGDVEGEGKGGGTSPDGGSQTGEAAVASSDASGSGDGRGQAAARVAVASDDGTRGAPPRRARTAVARPSPADATTRPSRPYQWATISAPADRPDWALHRATDAERAALMLAAVTGQGPLDRDLAIEAVRHGLDVRAILTNGRTRLGDALDRLEADGAVIATEGGFYDLPGRPVLPRDRSGCDERLRRLATLPPVEIDAAIREELAQRGPAEEGDVVVGAARRLGYPLKSSATNPALAELIARRIAVLVEAADEPVIRGADGLGLAPPPADHRQDGDHRQDTDRADAGFGSTVDPDHRAEDWPPMLDAAE